MVSAAQAFLPIIERVEVEGAEPGLHILILIFYWLTLMSFTRRWRGGAMAADDWLWKLSVKAGGRPRRQINSWTRECEPRPSGRSFKEVVDLYKRSLMWA